MTHDVFISYSRGDSDFALALYSALEKVGIDSWIDTADIRGGSNWLNDLTEALVASKVVILLLSSHSNESQFVSNEIQIANEEKKTIIPIMIENVPVANTIRPLIAVIYRIDATSKPFSRHLPKIVDEIKVALRKIEPELNSKHIDSAKGARRENRLSSWMILSTISILVVSLAYILFVRVKVTNIHMELELHGLSLGISSDKSLLFEEPQTPVSIGVSGLSGIKWSSNINLPTSSSDARAILLDVDEDNNDNDGQIGFNVHLPAKSKVRILTSNQNNTMHIAIWDLGESVPDVTVRGRMTIVPQRYGIHEMTVEPSLIQFLPEEQNEMAFELRMAEGSFPVEIQNIHINHLQTTLLEFTDQLNSQPEESMIKSGSVHFREARKTPYQLTKGEKLRFNNIKGVITELIIKEDGIQLSFNGRVENLQSGFYGSFTSLMPTKIQQLMMRD